MHTANIQFIEEDEEDDTFLQKEKGIEKAYKNRGIETDLSNHI